MTMNSSRSAPVASHHYAANPFDTAFNRPPSYASMTKAPSMTHLDDNMNMMPVVHEGGMSTTAKIGLGIGIVATGAIGIGAGVGIGYLAFHGNDVTTNENTYIFPEPSDPGQPVPDWLA